MGRLIYEGRHRLVTDDRTLHHLQWVIGDKLRRHESFMVTWTQTLEEGGGRLSVWMHPAAAVTYTYDQRDRVPLNVSWLQVLTAAANSPSGLWLVPEPEHDERSPDRSIVP